MQQIEPLILLLVIVKMDILMMEPILYAYNVLINALHAEETLIIVSLVKGIDYHLSVIALNITMMMGFQSNVQNVKIIAVHAQSLDVLRA